MKRAYVMGVLFGLCVMGCGEDTEPGQVADAGVDQGSDVGVEQDAGADASPDLPPDAGMCEAQTLCLPGQCGVIDDGCGGMLECQPCLCKDGEPLVPSCGTCDLGTISCDMGDRYPSCVQPELPAGVQLDCANVVYFDPTATETGMGSREVPYKSLDEALGRVNALGGGAVIWGGDGELEYGKEFEIPESVLLLGGFDAGTFAYNPAKKPTLLLVPSQPTNGAVLVRNASRKTMLHNLRVEVRGGFSGLTLHGIRAVSSPGLVLSRVDVVVPDGVPGLDGSPGVSGTDGTKGADGNTNGNQTFGGTTGRSCGGMATNFLGGTGGKGGVSVISPAGERGGAGADAPDGGPMGGAPGFEGVQAPESGSAAGSGRMYATAAAPGASGAAELRVEQGRVVGSLDGQSGSAGGRGASGGGGGGATYCPSPQCQPAERGPSGGAGGGGGCGGEGGRGGQGGGSVVGLLAVDSTGLEVLESTFVVGSGGAGGEGGAGGAGGQGGAGGASATLVRNNLFLASGVGGRGGAGQRGGAGGGGAGGSAYGVWCSNSRLRDLNAQAQITVGDGGKGAQGALDGVSAPLQGCTP